MISLVEKYRGVEYSKHKVLIKTENKEANLQFFIYAMIPEARSEKKKAISEKRACLTKNNLVLD